MQQTSPAKSPASGLAAVGGALALSARAGRHFARAIEFVSQRLPSNVAAFPAGAGFQLVRFFSLTSLVVMAVVAAIVIVLFQANQSATLLRIAESQNSALARSFANTIWLTHGDYLSGVGNVSGDELRARPQTWDLDRELRKIASGLPVLKVKIYNAPGLTIYSSEHSQIGESKSDNVGFQTAIRTLMPVSKMSFRGSFSAFSGIVSQVDLAESYVPIVSADGALKGVFELYTEITPHVVNMRRDNWIAATIVIIASLAIYLALLLVVRRADGILQHQDGELRKQHDALATANKGLVAARQVADNLNASLKEKVLQLERSNKDLQDFAHIAAHDLQEPLRKIEAFGSRLVTKYGKTLPDDGRMFVDRMQDATVRMRGLITDLLSFARLAKGSKSFSTVDLNAIATGVLSDLQVRIEETGAQVTIGTLPVIEANPAHLRQLMQNLIANALKFRRPDVAPIVEISAEIVPAVGNQAAMLHLKVADNGIGFDNQFRDKLFKLFQRLHGRNEYEGTGVGLATCRRIAEFHGGSIDAEGRLGAGATFELRIPMMQAVPPLQAPSQPAVSGGALIPA